jgi:D-3-phosphoglycerate dehydrogenase
MTAMKTSFPKQDIQVLLLEGVSRSARDAVAAAGYSNIEFHEKALPDAEL